MQDEAGALKKILGDVLYEHMQRHFTAPQKAKAAEIALADLDEPYLLVMRAVRTRYQKVRRDPDFSRRFDWNNNHVVIVGECAYYLRHFDRLCRGWNTVMDLDFVEQTLRWIVGEYPTPPESIEEPRRRRRVQEK